MNRIKFFLICFIPLGIWAQNSEKKIFNKEFNLGEHAPLYVSYYGNYVTHPGLKVGFDWNLMTIEKTKEKKNQIKTIRYLFLATPSVAFFNLSETYNALVVSGDISWRRYDKRLFYEEIGVGLGYYTLFNIGDTWETNADGTVSNTGSSSNGYLAPSVSFALGQRFMLKNQTPMEVFTKFNTNFLMNYNASTIAEISLELGVRLNLNWGIRTGEVKTKNK